MKNGNMVLINLNTGAAMQVEPAMRFGRLVTLNLSDYAKSHQEPPISDFLQPYLNQRKTEKSETRKAQSGASGLEEYSTSECVQADKLGIKLAPMFEHDSSDTDWANN